MWSLFNFELMEDQSNVADGGSVATILRSNKLVPDHLNRANIIISIKPFDKALMMITSKLWSLVEYILMPSPTARPLRLSFVFS